MKKIILLLCCFILSACGFAPQGEKQLAGPLHRLYLQTPDTYDTLERNLRDYLKMSGVHLTDSPANADTMLIVSSDTTSQNLLSVSGTQQTRQYNLNVTVTFYITTPKGQILLPTQTLSANQTITVQLNQILGSSNEASMYYQQMHRSLANAIMDRIASRQVTAIINKQFYKSRNASQ